MASWCISHIVLVLLLIPPWNHGLSTFNDRAISSDFPLCIYNSSDLVYDRFENIDTYATFLKCLSRISGPKLIPSLNQSEPVKIYTSLELNNIGDIDPAGALVELDFYVRFWWNDPRLNMPAYWKSFKKGTEEVHLDRIFYDSAGIFIWRPDIFFPDGLDIKVLRNSKSLNATHVNIISTIITQCRFKEKASSSMLRLRFIGSSTSLLYFHNNIFLFKNSQMTLNK